MDCLRGIKTLTGPLGIFSVALSISDSCCRNVWNAHVFGKNVALCVWVCVSSTIVFAEDEQGAGRELKRSIADCA